MDALLQEKQAFDDLLKPPRIPAQLQALSDETIAIHLETLKARFWKDFTQAFAFPRPMICFKTVSGKTTETLLETQIPTEFVGFLEFFALVHPAVSNFFLHFYVDGSLVNTYNYSVASIDQPLKFEPPWVVHNSVKLTAVNNTSKPYQCGGLFEGQLRKAVPQEAWHVVDGDLQLVNQELLKRLDLGE